MKYEEFDKLVEEPNPERKQALFNRIIEGLPYPAEIWNTESPSAATAAEKPTAEKPAAKKWRTSFKNFFKKPARLAACVSAAVAVVCVAIMLPFTLNGGNGLQATTPSTSDNPSISEDRFCAAATCKEIELKYSLKEYSQLNNLSLLYVDWYDVAEIKTSMYVNKENSFDIVYYQEILMHKYAEKSIVELYITDLRTNVDMLVDYMKACKNKYVPQNPRATVYWGYDTAENGEHNMYAASILYENRVYVLVLRYPMSENSIFEVIDSMLPEFKR